MPTRVPEDMVKSGRFVAGICIVSASVLGVQQYRSIAQVGVFDIYVVLVGSFAAVMGIAGLIHPGLLWSLSSRRNELPGLVRHSGWLLLALMVALALGLTWYLKGGRLF